MPDVHVLAPIALLHAGERLRVWDDRLWAPVAGGHGAREVHFEREYDRNVPTTTSAQTRAWEAALDHAATGLAFIDGHLHQEVNEPVYVATAEQLWLSPEKAYLRLDVRAWNECNQRINSGLTRVFRADQWNLIEAWANQRGVRNCTAEQLLMVAMPDALGTFTNRPDNEGRNQARDTLVNAIDTFRYAVTGASEVAFKWPEGVDAEQAWSDLRAAHNAMNGAAGAVAQVGSHRRVAPAGEWKVTRAAV